MHNSIEGNSVERRASSLSIRKVTKMKSLSVQRRLVLDDSFQKLSPRKTKLQQNPEHSNDSLSYYSAGTSVRSNSPQSGKLCINDQLGIRKENDQKMSEKQEEMIEIKKQSLSSIEPKLKTAVSGIEMEEDAYFYRQGKWQKTKFMITSDTIAFIQMSIPFSEIEKIKILPGRSNIKHEQILKIQVGKYSYLSALSSKRYKGQPLSYLVFAKIIYRKLQERKMCLDYPWQKTHHIEPKVMLDSYIFGNIYKRSQHLKAWSLRYVVIKQQGLFSYRQCSKLENYSFFISRASVRYIWTRFDEVHNMLVVKIKHKLNKTEFGIPVGEFILAKGASNWLFQFFRLLV